VFAERQSREGEVRDPDACRSRAIARLGGFAIAARAGKSTRAHQTRQRREDSDAVE